MKNRRNPKPRANPGFTGGSGDDGEGLLSFDLRYLRFLLCNSVRSLGQEIAEEAEKTTSPQHRDALLCFLCVLLFNRIEQVGPKAAYL